MAALWWTKDLRDLNPNSNVVEYKNLIADGMMRAGYASVQVTDSEVSGEKGAMLLRFATYKSLATDSGRSSHVVGIPQSMPSFSQTSFARSQVVSASLSSGHSSLAPRSELSTEPNPLNVRTTQRCFLSTRRVGASWRW